MEHHVNSLSPLRKLLRALSHPAATCSWLLLILLPLLWAGCYNHPTADDYSNSVWTDFWAYQRFAYLKLTGRVVSSFVVSLNPIRWGSFGGYQLAAILLIIVFALTYALTISRLLKLVTQLPFSVRFALGAASTGLIFNGLPSLAEGFYWFTGSMTYTLPVLMLCWAILIGLRLHDKRRLPTILYGLQALLLALATTGNEVIIPVLGLTTAGLAYYYRRQRTKALSRWYLALTAVWMIAAAIELSAPGNFVRQAEQHRNMGIALPTWLYFSKDLFLEWISDPVFFLYSVACIAALARAPLRPGLKAPAAMLLSLALIAIIMFPGFWGLGGVPPRRVRNLCYMVFVPGWLYVLAALAQWIRELAGRSPQAWRALRTPLYIGIGLLLLSQFRIETIRASSNYFMLAKNFRKGTLRNYDAEQRARYELLRNSPGDTMQVPRLRSTQSNMVFFGDLNADPDGYPNPGVAKYWGKRRLSLLPDSASAR